MDLRQDSSSPLENFQSRVQIALWFVTACLVLLFFRFFWLQVIKHTKYSTASESNRIAIITTPAQRGLIIDRHGVVIARNFPSYSLEVTPAALTISVEQLIDDLNLIVRISPKDRLNFLRSLQGAKKTESLPIRNFLNDEEVARFFSRKYAFPGVEIQVRYFREYPYQQLGSHLLGYTGRVSLKDREKLLAELEESQDDSVSDELRPMKIKGIQQVGKIGLEQSYEKELRGTVGYSEVEITAGGRVVRNLSSTAAVAGSNLSLAVDIKLQYLIEQLYGTRRGAAVVIEVATGDVLAFVSMPTFNPNAFVDGIDADLWKKLNDSPDKPLFNRPLRGTYPPGSTFKPFMALAALEGKFRTPEQGIFDPGFFKFGNTIFRDDAKGGHGYVNLRQSITVSCDTYYYILARDMGINAISSFMKQLGFGQVSGIDINGEVKGILPSKEWKMAYYSDPVRQKWGEGDTISIGIGQGYNSYTILQLAQATSILANRGVIMKPHLVKMIEDPISHEKILTVPSETTRLSLKKENLDAVSEGMIGVNQSGTGRVPFAGVAYPVAGKTGTAQVFSLGGKDYNAGSISEYKRDHALYIAFAPADKPKYALALVVENAGFGATSAAPIARNILDYLMLNTWPEGVPKWKTVP
jgi:penicillin-binding protein 2